MPISSTLVNVLNAGGRLDFKFTAPDEDEAADIEPDGVHSEDAVTEEPVKSDESEDISELTKKFLGED